MMRRMTGLAGFTTSAVVAIAMALPGAVAAAPADTQPDGAGPAGTASADLVEAMARDLGLTEHQARARLAAEAAAVGVEQRLDADLGASFAGAWLDDDATLMVGITDWSDADAVRSAGAKPTLVARSAGGLTAVQDQLDRHADKAPAAVAGWYVDVEANDVVLIAQPGQAAAAAAFVAGSGVGAGVVRVVVANERPRPLIDVIGGNPYFIGGGRCSIGFSVVGGFATAGHCGAEGVRTSQPDGTVRRSIFPGRDMGWVEVDPGNTPRPWVNDYAGGVVEVHGSAEAPVNGSICRSGSTTGWHCGRIEAKDQTVTYPQGTVNGLTRTSVCAEPGDSGGSWLSGNQAQGVTSGGSGNCTSGGTTYFQPINPILQEFGLTLLTAGSEPPPGGSGVLRRGETLDGGDEIRSQNGQYVLRMQSDGNLVQYDAAGRALWSSGTPGSGASHARFQNDGNFVLYTSGGSPVWHTGTHGTNADRLQVQDDGNLVIYGDDGSVRWTK